ncbi:hypothetical protein JCM8547_007915 [Rhodosporidiobolus lusitaniae]
MAPSPCSPVASTSRIPFSPSPSSSTSSPFHSSRFFSSSTPRPSPRSRTAHLIHPLLRQRLTNLTFALAGLLSVATVSLTMSGTLGNGAAPGCPARSRVGVAAEGEERERMRARAGKQEEGGWWKANGRFLEDPVVPAVGAVVPVAQVQAGTGPARRTERVEQEKNEGRIAGATAVHAEERGGWPGWAEANERIV